MILDTEYTGRVIQLIDALDYGDAVSNQVIALDAAFKRLGLDSAIYSKWSHADVASYREDLEKLVTSERDIVVMHFSLYSKYAAAAALNSYATRVILYHNITPAGFFESTSPHHALCARGREQLAEILPSFHYFWADSEYNLAELQALGAPHDRCCVIPIVVPPAAPFGEMEREEGSWLFVGRVAPNKRQLGLVDMFASVRRDQPNAAKRLYLVGNAPAEDPYVKQLRTRIADLHLQDCVFLTGKVSNSERESYYRRCAFFVSLSEHEGFGVPLVEASLRGIPVLALDNSAVGETLGRSRGLANGLDELRDAVIKVASDELYRAQLLRGQRQNAQRFAPDSVDRHVVTAFERILPRRRHFRTVSLVICTYNRCAYLGRVLDYLRYQTCSDFEVIIVDGPSTDGTEDLLRGYTGSVKVARNPERNLAKSRNLGIELAAGDIVAFVDDDGIPFDDWVQTVLNEYNSRPLTTGGLGGPVYYAGTFWFQAEDNGVNRLAEARVNIASQEIGRNGWLRYNTGTNATFLRSALVAGSGFDEQFDYYLDEADVCYRLQMKNWLIGYSPDVLLRHEFAQSHNRRGKFNYNWLSICKNTAYFVAAYSRLDGESIQRYLQERFANERVRPLSEAVEKGELTPEEYNRHVKAIHRGLKQGLRDALRAPKTRPLRQRESPFRPYHATANRLRVGREVRKLHVCIISKEFAGFAARGGVGTLFYHLASELVLMGHEVTVITPAERNHSHIQGRFRVLYTDRRDSELPLLRGGFGDNMRWAVSAFKALSDLHKSHPVDIIETCLWDSEALAVALASRRPPLVVRLVTPFLVSAETNGWQVPESEASFLSAAERALVERADAVVPISEAIGRTIVSKYGLSPTAKWRPVPCGIAYWPSFDVNQGYAEFQQFERIPQHVLDTEKLLVFVGRLERRKGIDLLLESASRFLAADNSAHLLIAGRDVEGWAAKFDAASDLRLRNRVHFLGEVADSTREKLLARAYCVIFPSRYESFGLVPLEAFVHGAPVIAAQSGAIPEVVVDGECGILFESDNSSSLADAAVRLLRDPILRQRLSLGAVERVRKLSSRNMAVGSMEIYSDLLRQHQGEKPFQRGLRNTDQARSSA